MIRPLLLLFAMLLFSNKGLVAQNFSTYWNYDISDGLPTNSIYHLFADSKGKIWFGSDFGVTSFDGQSFKTYTTDDGLEDNTVLRCFEDRSGKIWFHHNNRMPSYFLNGKIYKLKSNNNKFLITSSSNFGQLDNGNVYLGCSEGLLEIDENLNLKYIQEEAKNNYSIVGVKNNRLYLIDQSITKTKNVKSTNLLSIFLPLSKQLSNVSILLNRSIDYTLDNYAGVPLNNDFPEALIKLNTKTYYFLAEKNNRLFYTTSDGIYIFSKKNGKYELAEHILKNQKIVSLVFDKDGNMWASSLGNGLYFFPKNGVTKLMDESENKIVSQHKFDNKVVFGFENGDILYSNGRNLKPFLPLTSLYQFNSIIHNVYYESNGDYIIDYGNQLVYRIDQQKPVKLLNDIFASYTATVTKDKKNVYFTTAKGIHHLNLKRNEYLLKHYETLGRTRKIVQFQNEIYIATQTGLFKLVNDKPIQIFSKILKDGRINDLVVINDKLIIATGNSGLWQFDGKYFKNFSTKNGLLSNQVTLLRGTERNTIWIVTNLGLQELQLFKTKVIEKKRYDLTTNILTSEIEDLEDVGDYLLLTTELCLYSIENKSIKKLRKLNVFIEDFFVNSSKINKAKIEAEYGDNIKIITSAPNFTKDPTVYYYRINNGEWLKNNSETFSFLQLSPGQYKLDFYAKSTFFLDSDVISVNFRINEKWYQNVLFIMLISLFTSSLIIYVLRSRTLKVSERKRNELKTELLSLQSQMNPHFTFNSLNSIQGYMSSHNLREAQIYLADFAGLMRNILEQAKLHLISIDKEAEFLRSYLDLEMRRLDNQFEYSISVDENIESKQTFLPTLLIQPFVENAIWHGVAGLNYKGKIMVRFVLENGQIICKISDNGNGIAESESKKKFRPYHKSSGIENCKERIRLFEEIYRQKIELKIKSDEKNKKGTVVKLTFPILKQNLKNT